MLPKVIEEICHRVRQVAEQSGLCGYLCTMCIETWQLCVEHPRPEIGEMNLSVEA